MRKRELSRAQLGALSGQLFMEALWIKICKPLLRVR